MKRIVRLFFFSSVLLVLFFSSYYEWVWFSNFFLGISRVWYLIFASILLHNLWTGTVVALAFYFAAEIAEGIYPKVVERDPVFRHPRFSSIILSVFLVLFSILKVPPASLQYIGLKIIPPLLIIAAFEIYGSYCLIQMGLKRRFDAGGALKAFSSFLCGAFIEAVYIILA